MMNFFLLLVIINAIAAIQISTELGDIIGNVHTIESATVYEWLGIQYGVAPVGELRFTACQLNESWNTTYDARNVGPACIQNTAYESKEAEMSEDCLYLNIWSSSKDKNANLPVMIWIHGGGFITGAGSDKTYNARNVVALSQNMVIVTLNYRLGPLGFLTNTNIYQQYGFYGGLNGVYDQIQAINWVFKYIQNFGGNPNDLTIYGESAGGLSTCMLMVSPIVNKQPFKIKRAIIESGSCIGGWGPQDIEIGLGWNDAILTLNGYSTDLTKLRTYNATEMVYKLLNSSNNVWFPAVDNFILHKTADKLYSDPKTYSPFNVEESVIIGFNSMDGVVAYPWNVGDYPTTNAQYKQFLENYISNSTQVDLIYNTYYPTSAYPRYNQHTSASLAYFAINCDVCLACTTLLQMDEILNNTKGNIKGYVYLFRGTQEPYYAGHASELNFVFDHNYPVENVFFEVAWDKNLSESMVSAWTNMGKYGVPNVTNAASNTNVLWMEYETAKSESNVIIFDDNIRIKSGFKQSYRSNNVCNFWYNEVGEDTMNKLCADGAGSINEFPQ